MFSYVEILEREAEEQQQLNLRSQADHYLSGCLLPLKKHRLWVDQLHGSETKPRKTTSARTHFVDTHFVRREIDNYNTP